jgi:hypothetical protein
MSERAPLLQVVPNLGVQMDAVADYARVLGRALALQGIPSRFLSGNPLDAGGNDASRESSLNARTGDALLQTLERGVGQGNSAKPTTVLLHYVNYGFAPRGCPFWLVDGLESWKRRNPRARLVAIFHELYASGPPWRSSFWLSPVQRHLASRIARLADLAITNSEFYGTKLLAWAPAKRNQILVRPVFSTIGEPAKPKAWTDKSPIMAVLGRAGTEIGAYGRHRQALASMARMLGIDEIIDIGPRSRPVPREVEGIKVRTTGRLPAEEVSKLLSECQLGFLDYPSDVLGKSTVFAAYCAHGLVPAITHVRGAGLDGLCEGEHFVLARSRFPAVLPSDVIERISNSALEWYCEHAVAKQAATLSMVLK